MRRNVKWAFQLESFPAPDFVKSRPVFGAGMVKGILKRSRNATAPITSDRAVYWHDV